MTFSNNATVEFDFLSDVNANNEAVTKAVSRTDIMGGFTNIPEAFEKMIEVVSATGARY